MRSLPVVGVDSSCDGGSGCPRRHYTAPCNTQKYRPWLSQPGSAVWSSSTDTKGSASITTPGGALLIQGDELDGGDPRYRLGLGATVARSIRCSHGPEPPRIEARLIEAKQVADGEADAGGWGRISANPRVRRW